MVETAFAQFWQLIASGIALKQEAFSTIQTLPFGDRAAICVVIMAGLSRAIGQGVVLFINRVKPIRFILSLLISALLYAFSYIFWTLSTWGVSNLLFSTETSLNAVIRVLGLAYAPQLLSFSEALPYLGVPLSVVISVWSLLALLEGLEVASGLGTWSAFLCCALGWGVFQVLQRTIGRPIIVFGQRLANLVAGVKLETDLKQLEQIVQTGLQKTLLSQAPIQTDDKER